MARRNVAAATFRARMLFGDFRRSVISSVAFCQSLVKSFFQTKTTKANPR
jgi:hypothetical protein